MESAKSFHEDNLLICKAGFGAECSRANLALKHSNPCGCQIPHYCGGLISLVITVRSLIFEGEEELMP